MTEAICFWNHVSVQHVRDILGVDTLKEVVENVESWNIVAFIKDTIFFILA